MKTLKYAQHTAVVGVQLHGCKICFLFDLVLVLVLLYFWPYSSKLVTNTAGDPYVAIKYKTKGFFIWGSKRKSLERGRASIHVTTDE